MSLSCSFNIKVENITDIIGKDTFKNLTQEECESVITQLMSSYNLTQEALLDNKYKSDIINAIKRGREEASKAALANIETEMQHILKNAPRDSEGNLLAPNGKKSNLTERQYAQVRTKAFKDWFGDWEKGLIVQQDDKSYYRGQYDEPIIDKDGNLRLKGRKDDLYNRVGYSVETGVSATTDMITANEYGETRYQAYISDIEDKYGELDNSWEKEEKINEIIEHGYYLIQFPKNIANQIINEAGEVKIVGDIVIPKGQYIIEHITDEGTEVLATSNNNASKIVDKNGEPLVVYHGGSNTKVFDTSGNTPGGAGIKKGIKGTYFTTSKQNAQFYENIYEFNISEIWSAYIDDMREQGASEEEIKALYEEQENEKPTTRAFFLNIKNPVETYYYGNNKDGYTEKSSTTDKSDGQHIKIEDRDYEEYVAINPNQIKSATDNSGIFSTTNDDIYDTIEASVNQNSSEVTAPTEIKEVKDKEDTITNNNKIVMDPNAGLNAAKTKDRRKQNKNNKNSNNKVNPRPTRLIPSRLTWGVWEGFTNKEGKPIDVQQSIKELSKFYTKEEWNQLSDEIMEKELICKGIY